MSTTFVLHGGETSRESFENDKFFQEFSSLTNKDNVSILMCYWCRDKSRWEGLFNRDIAKIKKQSKKKMTFALTNSPKELFSQIDNYDVLYIAGGDAEPLEILLPELTWLRDKLQNKVFLGSSMGAFIVTEKYVLSYDSQDTRSVHTGLGILPINCLVHWDKETEKETKISLLQEVSNKPIILLDECESAKFIF